MLCNRAFFLPFMSKGYSPKTFLKTKVKLIYIPKDSTGDTIPCLYYRGGATKKTILLFHGVAVDISSPGNRYKVKTLGD